MQMRPHDMESPAGRYHDAAEAVRYRARRARRDVADAIDGGMHDAKRKFRRGRHAVEDTFDDVEDLIRRTPVRSVLLGFGVGAALGLVAMALAGRRKV